MNKIKHLLVEIKSTFFPSKRTKMTREFIADNGEEKRYIYPLNKNSVVFDIGGYKGDFASEIFSRYQSKIYVFEPIVEFAEKIKERFECNSNIKAYCFGLSNKSAKVIMNLDGDKSSSKIKGNYETFNHDINNFLINEDIDKIDLIKINIEGDEYDLLDRLIEIDKIKDIKNIQIQFHDCVPNAKERMDRIQKELSKTHKLTYQYPFLWENWELK